MNKLLIRWELLSTLFIFILGTLLHFTYEWSGNNPIVGLISAVNESTWEHLKLIFFPMLLTILVGHVYLKDEYPNYLSNKTKGLLVGIIFIVVFFYTSSGIIGENIALINISSFYIGVILAEFYTYKKCQKNKITKSNKFSLFLLLVILVCFFTFTFYPPHIGIFKNPITGSYGILNTNW